MLCSHCNIAHCFTKPTNITLIFWNRAYGKEVMAICSDSQAHHEESDGLQQIKRVL